MKFTKYTFLVFILVFSGSIWALICVLLFGEFSDLNDFLQLLVEVLFLPILVSPFLVGSDKLNKWVDQDINKITNKEKGYYIQRFSTISFDIQSQISRLKSIDEQTQLEIEETFKLAEEELEIALDDFEIMQSLYQWFNKKNNRENLKKYIVNHILLLPIQNQQYRKQFASDINHCMNFLKISFRENGYVKLPPNLSKNLTSCLKSGFLSNIDKYDEALNLIKRYDELLILPRQLSFLELHFKILRKDIPKPPRTKLLLDAHIDDLIAQIKDFEERENL